MSAESYASRIIDLAAKHDFVEDFSIEIHEGVVVEARVELSEGFVDVYRNFETGKTAFAWIIEEERVYGADNTGGWHIHPFDNPESHEECDEVEVEEFFGTIYRKLD